MLGGSFGGLGSGWVTWGGSKGAGIHSSLGAVRKQGNSTIGCLSESPLQGGEAEVRLKLELVKKLLISA